MAWVAAEVGHRQAVGRSRPGERESGHEQGGGLVSIGPGGEGGAQVGSGRREKMGQFG